MATIQKRDSENEMPNTLSNNVGLVKSENEIPNTPSDNVGLFKSDDPVKSIVDRTADMLAAWGAGRFDVGEVEAALAAFFTNDFVLDASSAAYSGVAAYKVHNGFSGLKDWFAFVGSFDFEEMEITHGSGLAAGEVWMRFSAKKAVCKATGKSVPFTSLSVLEWEGDKATKMTIAVHNPASVAAIVSETEIPMPMSIPLPPFEPHLSPLEPFGEIMALWGAGEFGKPEVRARYCAADCVDDLTDVALAAGPLSDVFKPFVGVDEIGVWIGHQAAQWEMSNLEVAPVVGLKPGCVMLRMKFDVTHTSTCKEAKGVEGFNELAYNADGQFVYARHYWLNAPLLASIY